MAWISDYQRWLSEEESLQNAQLVANHFSNAGWSPESISALCGNMRHESSINPDMYEYGYDWSADRGYGLVQWTPRSKYWNWAVSRNLPPRDGNSQLARIDYEVDQNIQWIPIADYNYMTFAEFRSNAGNWSVSYLTEAFTWSYERPNRQAGQDSMPSRKAFANRVFTELSFDGVGGGYPAYPTVEEGTQISSPYGWRINPITGEEEFHGAIDISSGGRNVPIFATQTGIVYDKGFDGINTGRGYWIMIEHTHDPYYSRYIHLAEPSPISIGATVTKGQEIGTMGTTGSSTGIHLDFAIATTPYGWGSEATTIDPELYLQMFFGDDGGTGDTGRNRQKDIITLLLSDALNGWKL